MIQERGDGVYVRDGTLDATEMWVVYGKVTLRALKERERTGAILYNEWDD